MAMFAGYCLLLRSCYSGHDRLFHFVVMRSDCEQLFVAFHPYGPEIAYQFHVCLVRQAASRI
jgi:hypothetical protein